PISTVYIAPIPRVASLLEMWIHAPIVEFVDLNQVIYLAPGYEIALRYNFAMAILPEYPRSQIDPTLPAQAQNYKAALVQLNASPHLPGFPRVPPKAIGGQTGPPGNGKPIRSHRPPRQYPGAVRIYAARTCVSGGRGGRRRDGRRGKPLYYAP